MKQPTTIKIIYAHDDGMYVKYQFTYLMIFLFLGFFFFFFTSIDLYLISKLKGWQWWLFDSDELLFCCRMLLKMQLISSNLICI